jgi:protein-tyrosine-phosphatase
VRVGLPSLCLVAAVFLWHRDKTLVFVSAGGTCRETMAKVIATQILNDRKPGTRINIRAAGLGPGDTTEAAYAARYTIREMYGKDLLKGYRPELLTPDLVAKADLILAMGSSRDSDLFAAGVDIAGVHLWGSFLDTENVPSRHPWQPRWTSGRPASFSLREMMIATSSSYRR